ncbi:MAG: hypothetical protein ACOYOT_00030 [Bacteroidales bacterium]
MKSTLKQLVLIFFLMSAFMAANAVGATYKWVGTTSTDYQVPTNWSPARTTPDATDSIVFTPSAAAGITITNVKAETIASLAVVGTGSVTMTGGINSLVIVSYLRINSGNTLDVRTLKLSGGTFTSIGEGVLKVANVVPLPNRKKWSFDIVLNGTKTQSLSGGTYNNVTIDNSTNIGSIAVFVGGGDVTITGKLTLTRGMLAFNNSIDGRTGTLRTLYMNPGSTIEGGSSASYILAVGSFVRRGVGSNELVYPVGTANGYTPLTIKNTSAVNPNITVIVKPKLTNAPIDSTKIVNLEWSVKSSTGNTTADITFQFNSTDFAKAYNAGAASFLGNFKTEYTVAPVGTSNGSNPYTVTAKGLSIPSFGNNFYVIGNKSALPSAASSAK